MHLLDRFRSVHDAFKQLDGTGVRDKELSLAEFHVALARIDVDKKEADVLFKALDADRSGRVSMTEFLHALTDVSEQGLLWELRCRLNQNGICYSNLHKAFDLIRKFDGEAKNNRTRFGGCVLTGEERSKLRNMRETLQMGRVEWLKFGSSLGLTIFETERLFDIIDKDSSGTVDLQEMFAALCAAAPDVSLERFVTKVLIQYGTLHDAFKSHAHKGFIGVQEFLALCMTVDLNKENAMRIWEARECRTGPDSPTRDDPRGQPALREDEFMRQMQAWAPATALDRLREQMCEQFGSVVEGKNALQKAGVGRKDVLSSQIFEAGLRATGLQHCDSGLLLHTVAGHRDKHHASPQKGVTLDQVVGALSTGKSDTYEKARKAARLSVGNDMGPYWQQLHAMKSDLRNGLDQPAKLASDGQFAFGDKGDRLTGVVQKAIDDLRQGKKQLDCRKHSVKPPAHQKRMHGQGPGRRGSRFRNREGRNVSGTGLMRQTFG
jgi:Ca2+-binding EF-hand superfamily protein